MYIGRLGSGTDADDGIYVLLKEVVDNAVDEFIMGHGRKIDVTIDGDWVAVRDYGRGIPLAKLMACASKINTGAKYDSKATWLDGLKPAFGEDTFFFDSPGQNKLPKTIQKP